MAASEAKLDRLSGLILDGVAGSNERITVKRSLDRLPYITRFMRYRAVT